MKGYVVERSRQVLVLVMVAIALLAGSCGRQSATPADLAVPDDAVGRVVYFRAVDCAPCEDVYATLIAPLEARCGASLEVKLVDVGTPEGYEAFVATESALIGDAGRWDVPAVVVEDTYYVGESAIRQELVAHLQCVFGAGGNDWPDVEALTGIAPSTQVPLSADGNPFKSGSTEDAESCLADETSAVCESAEPLFVLYLMRTDCTDDCDRTRYDLRYLRGVYPQLAFEERDIAENEALVAAIGDTLGIPAPQRDVTPLIVVGEDYLVGDAVTLKALDALIAKYAEGGASAFWYALEHDR